MTRTRDQNVDQTAGTLFPAGRRGGVKDSDERAYEIVGLGVGAKIAAEDGALDGSDQFGRDRVRVVEEGIMRISVTGATGFIGTELVKDLLSAGHEVRGLTRSDAGVEQLKANGADVVRGALTDLDSLRKGATGMDAVGTSLSITIGRNFRSHARKACAYVGDGANRWAAGPLQDVTRLYPLAVEKTGNGVATRLKRPPSILECSDTLRRSTCPPRVNGHAGHWIGSHQDRG